MIRGRRCAVVGGGMLGMRLALQLARYGAQVSLYERAPSLGGLASPWRIGDVRWDRFYHVVLPTDRFLLSLLDEIGLGERLRWNRASSAFFAGNRLSPFTTPLDFARFREIGWIDKARLANAVWRARTMDEAEIERLQSVPVERWLRECCGDRVFERLWRPLLIAKLGDDYAGVAASFILATIRRLYGSDRGADLQGRFGWVRGGYATIVDRFTRHLALAGVEIRTGTGVDAVEPSSQGGLLVRSGARAERYDAVALTVPPPIAQRMCPSIALRERAAWRDVRYRGVICVSLLSDRPLGSAYVTNLADERLPFSAIVETTNLVDPAELSGWHLVYVPKYVGLDDPYFALDDEEIATRCIAGLRLVHRRFDPAGVAAVRVARAPYVFAPPAVANATPPLRTSVPGLFLATSAQIVDGTLNVNQTFELAERAAVAIDAEPLHPQAHGVVA